MSRQPRQHLDNVDGILLYDKELGISSNRALQQVKHLFHAKKAGHTGSLDPLASGLLPICFGEATKISQYLIDSDKRYLTSFKLGESTTTGDAEGDLIALSPVNVSEKELVQALEKFHGVIEQVPPMFSALKKDGQPLYKLARKGIEVERKPRTVQIFHITVIEFSDNVVELDVHCSKGFYIRSLAIDLGEMLGCGAHVVKLRRTAVGQFHVSDAVGFDELSAMEQQRRLELLLTVDAGLCDMPAVSLSDDASIFFRQGQVVRTDAAAEEGIVRVYNDDLGFLGIGELLCGRRVKPKRLLNTNL